MCIRDRYQHCKNPDYHGGKLLSPEQNARKNLGLLPSRALAPEKLQTPSSKLQRSSKPQTSMRRPRMVTHRSGLGLELEIWSFSGAWSLELGVWGWGLGLWCAFGLRDFQN